MRQGIRRAGIAMVAVGVALLAGQAAAQDIVRHGLQRGALGALKVTLPMVQDKYKLKYDIKTFNDSTTVILALEQKELEIGNLTAQHVVRAPTFHLELRGQIDPMPQHGGGHSLHVVRSHEVATLEHRRRARSAEQRDRGTRRRAE